MSELLATPPADFRWWLGIDPGLCKTGYAVLERTERGPRLREGGVIRSTQKKPLAERVLEIATGLQEVFEQFRPEVMAIEQVFTTHAHPKSALLMAHARGVLLLVAAQRGIPIAHYTPRQIKRLLTGSGKAPKEQMQLAVQTELRLTKVLEPHDVADATAVALCHYYTSRQLPFRNCG